VLLLLLLGLLLGLVVLDGHHVGAPRSLRPRPAHQLALRPGRHASAVLYLGRAAAHPILPSAATSLDVDAGQRSDARVKAAARVTGLRRRQPTRCRLQGRGRRRALMAEDQHEYEAARSRRKGRELAAAEAAAAKAEAAEAAAMAAAAAGAADAANGGGEVGGSAAAQAAATTAATTLAVLQQRARAARGQRVRRAALVRRAARLADGDLRRGQGGPVLRARAGRTRRLGAKRQGAHPLQVAPKQPESCMMGIHCKHDRNRRRQTDGSRITRHSIHRHPARPSCRRPVLVSRSSRAAAVAWALA
jgi:hypothetical protein